MSATHNPYGPAQIDPAEWTYVGSFYQGTDDDVYHEYRSEHEYLAAKMGLTENYTDEDFWGICTQHDNGGCVMCGSHYAYGVVFTDGYEFIAIGHICSSEYLTLPDAATLARKRAAKAAETTRQRLAATAAAQEFLASRPELAAALEVDHYIIQDIRHYLGRKGYVSERQAELVIKIARDEAERVAAAAERAAALVDMPELTVGRYTLEGLVISTKAQDSDYGTQFKMLVELADGNRVYGTIPRAIEDEVWGTRSEVRVRFDAAVERSRDDEHFGFYKRPTKPSVVSVAAAEEVK